MQSNLPTEACKRKTASKQTWTYVNNVGFKILLKICPAKVLRKRKAKHLKYLIGLKDEFNVFW